MGLLRSKMAKFTWDRSEVFVCIHACGFPLPQFAGSCFNLQFICLYFTIFLFGEWRDCLLSCGHVQSANRQKKPQKKKRGDKGEKKGGGEKQVLLNSLEFLRCCGLLAHGSIWSLFVFAVYYSELQESQRDEIGAGLNTDRGLARLYQGGLFKVGSSLNLSYTIK